MTVRGSPVRIVDKFYISLDSRQICGGIFQCPGIGNNNVGLFRHLAPGLEVLGALVEQVLGSGPQVVDEQLVPAVGQGVMFKIAAALEDVAYKLLRIEPAGVGATSAMRMSARSSHPRRQAADRIARAFGSPVFDLYVDVPSLTSPRVLPGSPAAILLPPGFENLPRNEQAVGLARLGARASMLTRVGDEQMGTFVREALATAGVDVTHVRTAAGRLPSG